MDIGLARAAVTLDSRFDVLDQPVLLTGIQALVRVVLEQSRLDRAAGLHTAGLVSGYRGSPLGGLDHELWRQNKRLADHDVRFEPGVNEDLAAGMLFGTQQLDVFPGARFDGVFGMWYAKGPGVDRSGDALHCANMTGTHRHGGVLAVAGDDHGAHSSTYPHQTEHMFQNVFIPVLNPANVHDIIELGLAGYALSRFSGLWIALKTTAETVEQAATLTVRSSRSFITPAVTATPHGLNLDPALRFPADRADMERRVIQHRLPAALAWARANRLDRLVFGRDDAPIGLVTVGKAHEDTLHALHVLGLRHDPRIAVYKVAMTWPLETDGLRDFARNKHVLCVIEEKRSFVEAQLRDALYHLPADARPDIVGKTDARGAPLLSPLMELSPDSVAAALATVLRGAGIDVMPPAAPQPVRRDGTLARGPAFCAGCPHQTSTRVPDGSFATGGIGCHIMALDEGDQTRSFIQMGAEGTPFVGLAPFTDTAHTFANLGDGTYQHSGILAIRQALSAKARITYKLLFNDAVAMTGGQPAEGSPTVPRIAAQLAAEGVRRIAIVADDADRLPPARDLPSGTTRHTREQLDAVQRELRDHDGVSVLIYDQVCATEKRRRRKRGTMAQPTRHVVINEAVCENCGDCTTQSGCIAIEPVETELGRKRRINPTSCNVDLSCLKGFCPSFVTVAGPPAAPSADTIWQAREESLARELPNPVLPMDSLFATSTQAHALGTSAQTHALGTSAQAHLLGIRARGQAFGTTARGHAWRGLFAGIGGGGIVTAGAVLAMAAHLEGHAVRTLDFTGLSQKNGAVVAHVQIADRAEDLDVVRIPLGGADLMLAADLAVGCAPGVLERMAPDAAVVGNLDLAATAAFKHDPHLPIDAALHRRTLERAVDAGSSAWLHGVQLAERLFGNAQAMNTMLLGLAWQRGLVPVGRGAILRAIELNGAAVELNRRAFLWGRILAEHPELAGEILGSGAPDAAPAAMPVQALVETRATALAAYQSVAYAERYRRMLERVMARERAVAGRPGRLSRAVAEGLFRLMAYKDEYEVARLHAAASYGARPTFHLAPPLLSRLDAATGRKRKIEVPGWLAGPMFRVLRHGRLLRGTWADPFGWQAERRAERALVAEYVADVEMVLERLRPETLDDAVALAALPDMIRGFGPVKDANRAKAAERRAALLRRMGQGGQQVA